MRGKLAALKSPRQTENHILKNPMPELPEVETVARGLDQRIRGDVIESVWLTDKPQLYRKQRPAEIAATLEGAKVAGVRRVAKHVVFDLDKPRSEHAQWIVHLGMTGNLLVVDPQRELKKHTHVIAKLKSGRELRFVDPRRFGKLSLHTGFEGPGTEPLTVGLDEFMELFRGRKLAIKAALLNQSLLHGVGNIYADEALFRAGIRPTRKAGTLKREELKKLRTSLIRVLNEAIAAGGTSINDYRDAEGAEGLFEVKLRAYGRTGEPCLKCKTPIKRIVVGGRSTHYCPKCQQ
jgi:formamidopyrimidine-DNA glycosylase